MSAAPPPLDVTPVSRLFKALGDATRLRIVALLSHAELCVCHLETALGLAQPTVSRHLASLRVAGVVETRRMGSWVHYRLARQPDPECRRQLATLVRGFGKDARLAAEVKRLLAQGGPTSCR